MKWATRPRCHVDRLGCAWLIRRFIDPDAEFVFCEEIAEVPAGATAFDMPSAELSHHGANCTFETMLERYALTDASLHDIARIVHQADLRDDAFDAPEADGLDAVLSGLGLLHSDNEMIDSGALVFDAVYAHRSEMNARTASALNKGD